jgi:flavin reductase (DIM6/NTAB) family NADH-FMN oxidoreductase RutF
MTLVDISLEKWSLKPYHLWEKQSLLLTSGDFAAGDYNCMTVGWGSFGVMWGRPFAQIVVRPVRYTYQFMEKYPTFTLCAFPREYRQAINLLGNKSGRDSDKIAESGLTPTAASVVAAPIYTQAELAIECRKMYWQDFDPAHFLDPQIDKNYPRKDYHRIYFGEIMLVRGVV